MSKSRKVIEQGGRGETYRHSAESRAKEQTMRFEIVVNSVKGSTRNCRLYKVLEAQGFRQMDRWPSGSLSCWQSGSNDIDWIDWVVIFAVIRLLRAEVEIKTEMC